MNLFKKHIFLLSIINIYLYFLSILDMCLIQCIIIILLLINYQQLKKIFSMKNSQMKMKEKRHLTDLTPFTPLTDYETYDLDQSTSIEIIHMLIHEAKQTNKFSYTTYYDDKSNEKYSIIHFIQSTSSSSSILIKIEMFERIFNGLFYDKIQQLLTIIFFSSNNIIYSWNFLSFPPQEFQIYDIFYDNTDKINQKNFVALQHHFKCWYNSTFNHNENCDQIIDYMDIDGPLCSCSHRPFKSPTDTWSLSMAIMFTFHENLQLDNHPINQCLAITKLAVIMNY